MKKRKPQIKQVTKISPKEAVEFLESFRKMAEYKDERSTMISIRIPENILKMVKTKAKSENKKYQSLIVQYIRKGLESS